MQAPGRSTFLATRQGSQRGQASAEYLVLTAVMIGVLLMEAGDTVAPLISLVAGFKSFFSAYSFTLSLP